MLQCYCVYTACQDGRADLSRLLPAQSRPPTRTPLHPLPRLHQPPSSFILFRSPPTNPQTFPLPSPSQQPKITLTQNKNRLAAPQRDAGWEGDPTYFPLNTPTQTHTKTTK